MKKILLIIITVISSIEVLADQNNLFTKKNNQILPAEEAFGFNLKKMNQNIFATWEIKDGNYLYLQSVLVKIGDNEVKYKVIEGVALDYKDEFFGETEIIKNILKIEFKNDVLDMEAKIYYQGCSEKGFCYPIQEVKI